MNIVVARERRRLQPRGSGGAGANTHSPPAGHAPSAQRLSRQSAYCAIAFRPASVMRSQVTFAFTLACDLRLVMGVSAIKEIHA
jgi:hypothetical protein